jgi:uncharacterized Ntn-hydrolase superfamily protein
MTFSMVARCPKTLALGVCVSTAIPAVGSVVPHVDLDAGAIATQGNTNIFYGVKGLKLLKMGFSPKTTLEALLREDGERETRQVIIIDRFGETAAFTGKETIEWKGHKTGENYVVAGNMLVGSQVIEAMAETFETASGNLAERLMQALEAGQKAGGDKRGKSSAAIKVMDKNWRGVRPFLDLRVDDHPNPVVELRRIFEKSREFFQWF